MSTCRGSILVLVAGISALLAAMTMAFIVNIRNESEEVQRLERFAQNRLMLHAALSYIQESSRLGYGAMASGSSSRYLPATLDNTEAYGWLDVRTAVVDGIALPGMSRNPGPYAQYDTGPSAIIKPLNLADVTGNGWLPAAPQSRKGYTWAQVQANSSGAFNPNPWPLWEPFDWRDLDIPIHQRRAARMPTHALERPPFSVSQTAAPNPMGGPWIFNGVQVRGVDTQGAYPLEVLPDTSPQRIVGTNSTDFYADWCSGDLRPRPESANKSWFRLFRDGPTTFVITVGSGGTMGYKDWAEVLDPDGIATTSDSRASDFADEATFNEMLSIEQRQWFRCEWSARIGDVSFGHFSSGGYLQWQTSWLPKNGNAFCNDNYFSFPFNGSLTSSFNMAETEQMQGVWSSQPTSRTVLRNFGGTFLWIQRLREPPSFY